MADEEIYEVRGTAPGIPRIHMQTSDVDEARLFIERNFPRAHVQEGTRHDTTPMSDVQLHHPDGKTEVFNGKWSASKDGVPYKAPVKATAAKTA